MTTGKNKRQSSHRKKKRERSSNSDWWKITLKTIVIVVLVLILAGTSYAAKLLADAHRIVNDAYTPRTVSTTLHGENMDHLNDDIDPLKDPISILVMGIDDDEERALGSARTDTMILVTVNPQEDLISMISIPRDTFTYIDTEPYQGMDRINIAYTYGGDEGAIQAVQDLMEIPINYFLTVDFIAFEQVINALGGIEIDVPFDIYEHYASEDYTSGELIIHEGLQTLNGEQALVFARMRKVDTDIERGKRGQLVIEQTIRKASEVGSITKYNNVLKAIDGHFWTDMPADTMMSIAQSGLTKHYDFASYTFSWMSFDYNIHGGISNMVGLHDDSLEYISHKLRVSLGLDKPDERDAEDYEFISNGVVSSKTYPKGWAIDEVQTYTTDNEIQYYEPPADNYTDDYGSWSTSNGNY